MNLRNLLTLIIISAGVMCGSAQTISTKHAHRAAHQQQLANAKLRMDKNVIQDFIKNDIGRREDAVANPDKLSSESAAMINDLLSEAKNHLGKDIVPEQKDRMLSTAPDSQVMFIASSGIRLEHPQETSLIKENQ